MRLMSRYQTSTSPPNPAHRKLAIWPLAFAVCLATLFAYWELVYYPTYGVLYQKIQAVDIHAAVVRNYEDALVRLTALGLVCTTLLAASIHAAFTARLRTTRYLRWAEIFIAGVAAIAGLGLVAITAGVMHVARTQGPTYYWHPSPVVYLVDAASVVAVLAVAALAMSPNQHHCKSTVGSIFTWGLGAVFVSVARMGFPSTYVSHPSRIVAWVSFNLVPLLLITAWCTVAWWIWKGDPSPPRRRQVRGRVETDSGGNPPLQTA